MPSIISERSRSQESSGNTSVFTTGILDAFDRFVSPGVTPSAGDDTQADGGQQPPTLLEAITGAPAACQSDDGVSPAEIPSVQYDRGRLTGPGTGGGLAENIAENAKAIITNYGIGAKQGYEEMERQSANSPRPLYEKGQNLNKGEFTDPYKEGGLAKVVKDFMAYEAMRQAAADPAAFERQLYDEPLNYSSDMTQNGNIAYKNMDVGTIGFSPRQGELSIFANGRNGVKDGLIRVVKRAVKAGIASGTLQNPAQSDYQFFEVGAGLGKFVGTAGGFMMDEQGNVYAMVDGSVGYGAGPPITFTMGKGHFGNADKSKRQDYVDALEGWSLGTTAGAGIYGSASVGTNGVVTGETSFNPSVGKTVGVRYAWYLFNINDE